jgi:hypothetical protein
MNTRWGSISVLADRTADWKRADAYGGIWRDFVRHRLGVTLSPPRPSIVRRVLDWTLRLFHLRWPTEKNWTPEELMAFLPECYAWLAHRSVDRAIPFFAPFWHDMPVDLASVSEKAVAWAVVACQVDRVGPSAMPTAGELQGYVLDRTASVADLWSLHLDVEDLVVGIGAKLTLPKLPRPRRREEQRRPGGLRRKEFLATYAALRLAAGERNHIAARRWLDTLDRFVAASPLTRLVYCDLVTPGRSSQEPWAIDIDGEGPRFIPLVRLPAEPSRETSPRRGWRDLWVAHLAKSMVGAVLSPSPACEQRLATEDSFRTAEQEYQKRAARLRPPRAPQTDWRCMEIKARMRTLMERRNQLIGVERAERLTRLALLHAIVGPRPAADGPAEALVSHHAKTYLQMRFLDMLVRQLAAENMPAIEAVWRRCSGQRTSHRRMTVLRTAESPLLGALIVALISDLQLATDETLPAEFTRPDFATLISALRQTLEQLNQRDREQFEQVASESSDGGQSGEDGNAVEESGDGQAGGKVVLSHFDWFRFHTDGLLNVGFDLADSQERSVCAEQLHSATGVTDEAARQLIRRFADDAVGIEVAFQGDNPNSFAPATLLGDWFETLAGSLTPTAQQSTSE